MSSSDWQRTRESVASLERCLGDPASDVSPVNFRSALRHDEDETVPLAEYRALDAWGLNRRLVPEALGGELRSLDELMLLFRSVFRRDSALGIGYGLSSLLAGLPVWHSGSAAQQARLAARLLAGDAVSVCFHERQHGSDVLGNEFRARRQDESYLLSGEKWLINNIGRAGAATVFARTRDGNTPRSHSLFFVEQDTLERGRVLARIKTVGIRGCALAGWAADDVPLDAEALVGAEGGGFEITAKAFQLSRAVLPGMAIGIVDSALRLCHDFLSRRRLYRMRAIDIPLVRRTLQTCFLDIVAADCLALAAARIAHAMPGQLGLASAIAKLWIPRRLDGTMKSLAVMLGARHYLRGGEYAGFQKLLRDFPVSYLVHTSAGVCQSLLIQQLRQIASSGGARGADFDVQSGLQQAFDLRERLPALRMEQLALSTCGGDVVVGGLRAMLARVDNGDGHHDVAPVVRRQICRYGNALCDAHDVLMARVRGELASVAADHPAWFDAATRYAQLYASACALWLWHCNPSPHEVGIDPQFRQGAWLAQMLESALGVEPSEPRTDGASVAATLAGRVAGNWSFGLLRLPYAGATQPADTEESTSQGSFP